MPHPRNDLTRSQRRIYELLMEGLSEKEVATVVASSVHTVHNHTQAVYRVFGVNSRAELMAWGHKTNGFHEEDG